MTPLLKSLAFLYRLLTRVRNELYDRGALRSYTSSLPVISIGNLSAGGNAKTPLTIAIAERLQLQGKNPVILSRGYGGKEAGPILVQTGMDPERVGDEPLLMAERGHKVVVAKKRVEGAKFIEHEKIGECIILDDGFQHRALSRSLDIVSINLASDAALAEFMANRQLPHGLFREDRDQALKRVNVLVFSSRSSSEVNLPVQLLSLVPRDIPYFSSCFEIEGVYDLSSGKLDTLQREVVPFCAIANPDGFFSTLRSLGLGVKDPVIFPDHHALGMSELIGIRKKHPVLPLVCTEKDAVKLRSLGGDNLKGCYFVRIKVKVAAEFYKLILDHIK